MTHPFPKISSPLWEHILKPTLRVRAISMSRKKENGPELGMGPQNLQGICKRFSVTFGKIRNHFTKLMQRDSCNPSTL